MSLISTYILLTLSHTLLTIFIERNKLLIKSNDLKFHESSISSCILLKLSHTLLTIFLVRNKLLIKFHESLISSYILLTLAHTLFVIVIAWEKKVVDQTFHEFDQFIYSSHTISYSFDYLHWEKQPTTLLYTCTMYNCRTWATRVNPFTAEDKFD